MATLITFSSLMRPTTLKPERIRISLRECDIDKIVETYEHRVDVDKYAHVATMQEIEENGFNLNIPRYVDTFEPEEEIRPQCCCSRNPQYSG